MRIIKLMPDYECHPLWEASPGEVGNIDPESLPISEELIRQLDHWASVFDATLNYDDPLASGFATTVDETKFKETGLLLAERLRRELGNDFDVVLKI